MQSDILFLFALTTIILRTSYKSVLQFSHWGNHSLLTVLLSISLLCCCFLTTSRNPASVESMVSRLLLRWARFNARIITHCTYISLNAIYQMCLKPFPNLISFLVPEPVFLSTVWFPLHLIWTRINALQESLHTVGCGREFSVSDKHRLLSSAFVPCTHPQEKCLCSPWASFLVQLSYRSKRTVIHTSFLSYLHYSRTFIVRFPVPPSSII